MSPVYVLAVLILSLVCAVLCHRIAASKGASPVFWAVMGFVFGPLAIPFVILVRKKTSIKSDTGD